MSIEIGQHVIIKSSVETDLLELNQVRDDAVEGVVYHIRPFEYSPNDIGVDFGVTRRWWFKEDELEVVS